MSKNKKFGSTYSAEEFQAACRPLMKWINDNCHPHHVVILDHTNAQLFEGEMSFVTQEYLRD